jgi:hypothetical protein
MDPAKLELLNGYDPVAAGEQDENGVDLELIRSNRSLSYEDRVEQHRRWATYVLTLMRASEAAGLRKARSGA